MLYREIIAVCSEIHTKHINTLCGRNVELLSVKPGGTYSKHWALEGGNAPDCDGPRAGNYQLQICFLICCEHFDWYAVCFSLPRPPPLPSARLCQLFCCFASCSAQGVGTVARFQPPGWSALLFTGLATLLASARCVLSHVCTVPWSLRYSFVCASSILSSSSREVQAFNWGSQFCEYSDWPKEWGFEFRKGHRLEGPPDLPFSGCRGSLADS
jgi:hypothetical protein